MNIPTTIPDTLESVTVNIYTNAIELYEGRRLTGRLYTNKPNVIAEIVRLGAAAKHITFRAATYPEKLTILQPQNKTFKFW